MAKKDKNVSIDIDMLVRVGEESLPSTAQQYIRAKSFLDNVAAAEPEAFGNGAGGADMAAWYRLRGYLQDIFATTATNLSDTGTALRTAASEYVGTDQDTRDSLVKSYGNWDPRATPPR